MQLRISGTQMVDYFDKCLLERTGLGLDSTSYAMLVLHTLSRLDSVLADCVCS